MSKASNPTRPTATTADVGQRLTALTAPQRRRLTDSGYSIEDLRRVADVDKQADAVDALLAIMLDRPGYVHDQADLKAAERVARTLGAKMDPKSWLVYRKKERPSPTVRPGLKPGQNASWVPMVVLVAAVVLVIVGIAVVAAL